jgi:hypothetical protein
VCVVAFCVGSDGKGHFLAKTTKGIVAAGASLFDINSSVVSESTNLKIG